jgi:hypothetical protein
MFEQGISSVVGASIEWIAFGARMGVEFPIEVARCAARSQETRPYALHRTGTSTVLRLRRTFFVP